MDAYAPLPLVVPGWDKSWIIDYIFDISLWEYTSLYHYGPVLWGVSCASETRLKQKLAAASGTVQLQSLHRKALIWHKYGQEQLD